MPPLDSHSRATADRVQPLLAGAVAACVGFFGAFAIVLAGLRAVGATDAQAMSGLLAVSVVGGLLTIALSAHYRMPAAIAWSTPGAALLVATGVPAGGWPAAVGAFVVCGALLLLAGLWGPLRRLVESIPGSIASALLAGILIPVCIEPARAAVETPAYALPMIVVWLALTLVAPRWAVPGSLIAVVVAMILDGVDLEGPLAPAVDFTTPSFELATMIGIGLPLFLVTMAGQNVAGLTVLRNSGYEPNVRPMLTSTGAATLLAAPLGAHGINLAAITQALVAGPVAGANRSLRWLAAVAMAVGMIVFGLMAGLVTAFAAATPPGLIEAVAGLALLGTLADSLAHAFEERAEREAAVVTLLVCVSAVTVAGISAPFWGLLAGLAFARLRATWRRSSHRESS